MNPRIAKPSACMILMLLTSVGIALAQTGGGYDLTWYTIDGGGHIFSNDAGYDLGGTIGQPDSGPESGPLTGGSYSLVGGFWPAAAAVCACPGDMNGDTKKNGKDVQMFVNCYVWGNGCSCADVDGSGGVTPADLNAFIADLLAGATCP